jgi:ketosteroid isomerase-like protein
MNRPKRTLRIGGAIAFAAVAILASVAVLDAHDFWLVPNALAVASGSDIEVLGQSGVRFPTSGGATQPTQVAEARIVGKSSDEKITDLSVSGKSLALRHKPRSAGQYVVAVALATRNARTTPARLQRYIALEGAPELAAQYEKDGAYPKADSVTQMSAKFAKTIVQVGDKGGRAYDKPVGHALEIVPLDDPSAVRVGGTVRVRLLFHGKPLSGAALRAGWGLPADVRADTPSVAPKPDQVVTTDAKGIATISVTDAGLWNVRTLYAAGMKGMPEHWEVYFATIVFGVSGATGDDQDGDGPTPIANYVASDSADVLAVAAKFHASLAAGDSAGALALLATDVTILESGGIETLADYRAHHLSADIEYAKAVPSQRTVTLVRVIGDVAWVSATSTTQGEFRGRPVNSAGAELMVLSRDRGTWKIRAIHWSSRRRTP